MSSAPLPTLTCAAQPWLCSRTNASEDQVSTRASTCSLDPLDSLPLKTTAMHVLSLSFLQEKRAHTRGTETAFSTSPTTTCCGSCSPTCGGGSLAHPHCLLTPPLFRCADLHACLSCCPLLTALVGLPPSLLFCPPMFTWSARSHLLQYSTHSHPLKAESRSRTPCGPYYVVRSMELSCFFRSLQSLLEYLTGHWAVHTFEFSHAKSQFQSRVP